MRRRTYKNKFTGPHTESVLRRVDTEYGYAVVSECPSCKLQHVQNLESHSNVHRTRHCKHCGYRFYSVLHKKAKNDPETQEILREMQYIFEHKKRRVAL